MRQMVWYDFRERGLKFKGVFGDAWSGAVSVPRKLLETLSLLRVGAICNISKISDSHFDQGSLQQVVYEV